jgi:hypothetical protein
MDQILKPNTSLAWPRDKDHGCGDGPPEKGHHGKPERKARLALKRKDEMEKVIQFDVVAEVNSRSQVI